MSFAHRLLLALTLTSLAALPSCADNPQAAPDLGDAGRDGYPDGSVSGNHAPVLARIGDKVAVVEEELVIMLRASDADGDLLEFSVFGDLPRGSAFYKEEARFHWTPGQADLDSQWTVTFSVSDGQETDRETITISVHATRDNSPPDFVEPGDQILTINQPYELMLEAVDPDGDALTYQVIGNIPEGSDFDGQNGVFRWTPTTQDADATYHLLFEVSDGQATDEMFVNLIVASAAITFPPIPPQEVRLNEELVLTLSVSNPAGRTIACAVLGTPPAGSTFQVDSCTFRWTPTDPALVGQTAQVSFQVSDAEVTLVQTASISVRPASAGECQPDAFEEMEAGDQTPVVEAGTYSDIPLCNEDIDVFAVALDVGAELVVTVTFDHNLLDIDLALFDPGAEQVFQLSNGYTNTETIRVESIPTAGYWYIAVYSEFTGSSTYDLTIEIDESGVCVPDLAEADGGNNDEDHAYLIENLDTLTDLTYCEQDWYYFGAQAGGGVLLTVDYDNQRYNRPTVILKRYGVAGAVGVVEYDAWGLTVTLDPVAFDDLYPFGLTNADQGMVYTLSLLVFDP
ncbi:MAG: PPC domain-containing protein [Bradymonadales bacterium]|nr:PPC domain-containing protein [Bradymonadales bacterium]